jgi:hypothetical protein
LTLGHNAASDRTAASDSCDHALTPNPSWMPSRIFFVPQNDVLLETPTSAISCAAVADRGALVFAAGVLAAEAEAVDAELVDELELPHAATPQARIAVATSNKALRALFFLIWTSSVRELIDNPTACLSTTLPRTTDSPRT